ncbi:MAG: LuxR C-terminal-related transcriptional regulator [Gaiellaceae bacterium]
MSANVRTAVLLDPHPLWLDALEDVLRRIDVTVARKTSAPREALEALDEVKPDLFVTEVDTLVPELDGIACVREARARAPQVKTIVLSMHEDAHLIDAALGAGAVAYVIKTAHADDLASAVRQVFDHSVFLASVRPLGVVPERIERNGSHDLTRRELEIIQLVAEGHSNAQLARMLWVTEQTIKFHLSNIYRKIDVSNRTEASRWAQIHGLLRQSSSAEPTAG